VESRVAKKGKKGLVMIALGDISNGQEPIGSHLEIR